MWGLLPLFLVPLLFACSSALIILFLFSFSLFALLLSAVCSFCGVGGIQPSRTFSHINANGLSTHDKTQHAWYLLSTLPACGVQGGRAEWLVEKASELGAAGFVPLTTARSSPQGVTTSSKFRKGNKGSGDQDEDYQPGRLERVAIAATKQSLRTHGLELAAPTPLEAMLGRVEAAEVSLVAAAGGSHVLEALEQVKRSASKPLQAGMQQGRVEGDRERLLLIGPEGDWTVEEMEMLVNAGAVPVGLGQNRLRTETAAIALLSAAVLCG